MIISILIFVSALVFGVISILRGSSMRSNASYNDSAAKNAGSKKVITGGAIIVIGLIAAFIQPYSLEKIDAGNKEKWPNFSPTTARWSGTRWISVWADDVSQTPEVKIKQWRGIAYDPNN